MTEKQYREITTTFISILCVITAIVTFLHILPEAQNEQREREVHVSKIKSLNIELEQKTKQWEGKNGILFEASRSANPIFQEIQKERSAVIEKRRQEEETATEWDKKLLSTSKLGFAGTIAFFIELLLSALALKSKNTK